MLTRAWAGRPIASIASFAGEQNAIFADESAQIAAHSTYPRVRAGHRGRKFQVRAKNAIS